MSLAELHLFLGVFLSFPLSVVLLQTDKEDELSRRVKNVLGDGDSKALLSHESPLNLIWIPRKSKSQSQTLRHQQTCSKTKPCEDIWGESSPESPDLPPRPEQNCDSDEGPSNWKAEAEAEQSQLLPEPVKVSAVVGGSVVGSPSRPREQHTGPAWLGAQPRQSSKALGSQVQVGVLAGSSFSILGYCCALWNVGAHGAEPRQLGQESHREGFQTVFGLWKEKEELEAAVSFSWERLVISCKGLWAIPCGK